MPPTSDSRPTQPAPPPGALRRMRLVNEGSVIDGKYVVERLLGTGATGVVVAARNVALGQRVAIKILLPEARTEADRFLREARALAQLKSPHVVRVNDVGVLSSEASPNDTPYIVMEHLDGLNLRELLGQHGRLSVAAAVDCIVQACDAVHEAHAYDIVHRDLKPENLFLARGISGLPCVKVLDFGISKSSTHCVTATHAFLGTPSYMAPEQMASSRSVDARADVWSLGVVLYELLTGHNPFDGASLAVVMNAVRERAIPSLREQRAEIPVALEAIVMDCLARDANDRIGSARELCARLAPFASHHSQAIAARFAQSPPVRRPRPLRAQAPKLARRIAFSLTSGARRYLWPAAVLACIGTTLGAVTVVGNAENEISIPPAVAAVPAQATSLLARE